MNVRNVLLAATLCLVASTASFAGTIDTFELTGGKNLITFDLPSSPTPSLVESANEFTMQNVVVNINGSNQTFYVNFFSTAYSGGLCIATTDITCNGGDTLNQSGLQLFTGTTSAPTFTLGSYNLTNIGRSNGFGSNFTLTISSHEVAAAASPVPEPSSLLLLGSGLAGFAGVVRRKFKS